MRAMLPADKARIGSFGSRIQIDPPEFTSDRDALLKILRNELQADGPTPLWNAVDTGIDKLLLEQGRRVVLVFTDGVDMPMNFSATQQVAQGRDEARRGRERHGLRDRPRWPDRHAERGRTRRRHAGPRDGSGRIRRSRRTRSRRQPAVQMQKPDEGLPKIAAATGGGYFELTSPLALASTFARVADELHHQYALGFTPEKLDGKMHDLTVRLSKPDLTARARKRYLASKPRGGS